MSFSLNDTLFPCESEVEFKIVGSRPTGCMQLTNQKNIATYAQKMDSENDESKKM